MNRHIHLSVLIFVALATMSFSVGIGTTTAQQQTAANETALVEKSVNPPLRPIEWNNGDGQFPSYEREKTRGYSGYLERKSDDRRVGMKYMFDESQFDESVDTYLVVARIAWHANGNGDQHGVRTVEAKRDIPGDASGESWGTVRLPIDPSETPLFELKAIYGFGYLSSGTAVVRIHDITVVPASAAGRLSDDEILSITSEAQQQETETPQQVETDPPTKTPERTTEPTPAVTTTSPTQTPSQTDTPIAPSTEQTTGNSAPLDGRGLLLPDDGLLTGSINAFTLSVIGLLISLVGVVYTTWRQE